VAILVQQSFSPQLWAPKIDLPAYEVLWLSITRSSLTYLCRVLYHPPKPIYNKNDFLAYLEASVDEIHQTAVPAIANIYLAGDFNELTDDEISATTGLIPVVKDPTRGPSFLDKVFVMNDDNSTVRVVKPLVKTDHLAVLISCGHFAVSLKRDKRVCTLRAPKQHADFMAAGTSADFRDILASNDTQDCANALYSVMLGMLDRFYPVKTITLSERDPAFVTPENKLLLRKRNSLMRAGRVEEAGSICTKIGRSIAVFNSSKLTHIKPNAGTRDLWQEVSRLTKPANHDLCYPPTINAQSLNDHYCSISSDSCYTDPPPKLTAPIFSRHATFSEFEVFKLFDKLKPTTAGPDNIPSWFLRLGAPFLSNPISHLFSLSLATSTVPTQ